ncbi:MAG: hypothetical protein ACTHJW_16435 [Streptosporangiaceae bacterium]
MVARLPELQLTSRFLTDFYLLVGEWARWASGIVGTWPDDPRQAKVDPEVIAGTFTARPKERAPRRLADCPIQRPAQAGLLQL